MTTFGKIISEELENGEPEESNEKTDTDTKDGEKGHVNENVIEKMEENDIKIEENYGSKQEKEDMSAETNEQNGEEDDIVFVGQKDGDAEESKHNIENEDDGKSKEAESKSISDEVFFENISQDEKDFYTEEGHDPVDIEDMSIQCTACWKQVNHHVRNNIVRHPMLGVPICRACKAFYGEGEDWEKDEEGSDIYCRWCGNGGDLICCDSCTNAFCKRCIQRNKGRSKVAEITKAEKWDCFSCRPSQIFDIRSLAFAIFKWKTTIQALKLVKVREEKDKKKEKRLSIGKLQKEKVKEEKKKLLEKIREGKIREKQKEKELKAKAEAKAKAGMQTIRNFVDENIKEAFDTLEIYSKCLQDEKRRWLRVGNSMDANNAAVTVRSLRKIYSITQQNMNLLDTALVQAYGDSFPEESEKKLKIGGLPPSPNTKTSPSPKAKKPTPKKKIKKPVANAADCDVEEIVINGEPIFGLSDDENVFDPSQLCSAELIPGETGETEGDDEPEEEHKSPSKTKSSLTKLQSNSSITVSKPRPPLKVSTNMFKKKSPAKRMKPAQPKKKPAADAIEEITIEDSDGDEADTGYESQSISPVKKEQQEEQPSKKRRRSSDSDGSIELF